MHVLKNAWYCAGWSEDFGQNPIGQKLLGDYLVLYRDTDERVVAHAGRCPHRFAPLDKGSLTAQGLSCPYHGLVFDRNGICVANPFGGGEIPPRAKLRSYPVAELQGTVWVWMGDVEAADEGLIPTFPWLADPEFGTFKMYLKLDVNYQLVVDNLLDLTHVPLLHAGSLSAGAEDAAMLQHRFHSDGYVVHSDYSIANAAPQNIFGKIFPGRGDFKANMTWRPATVLTLEASMTGIAADPSSGVVINTLHYLAPETENTTHYYVGVSRNACIDDEIETQRMQQVIRHAFINEDEPMMRACAELMGTTDLLSLNPAILKPDASAIQARRILDKLIRREAQAEVGELA